MEHVLAIAPHPDDETLGCGATLLRHRAAGDKIHWLIVTRMGDNYTEKTRETRRREIESVAKLYGFTSTTELGFDTGTLRPANLPGLIDGIGAAVKKTGATTLYLPYEHDAHSDHRWVFQAGAACGKWFRFPSVRSVLSYEVPSETDASLSGPAFAPNVYVDAGRFIDKKLKIMRAYASETGKHPFPRGERALRALADVRGSQAGFEAAEAFLLLRDRRGA